MTNVALGTGGYMRLILALRIGECLRPVMAGGAVAG